MNLLRLLCLVLSTWLAQSASTVTKPVGKRKANQTCRAGERHIYVKLSAEEPLGTAEVVIPQMSLADCSHTCDQNLDSNGGNFSCAAFDYNPSGRRCLLSSSAGFRRDEPVLPGKVADLNKAVKDLFFGKLKKPNEETQSDHVEKTKTSGFYWKLCLPAKLSVPLPLSNQFAFEQFPNKVLTSSTEQIIKLDSVAECLQMCFEAKSQLGFVCKSAMYYYDSTDCLVNSADRATASEPLSSETEQFRVDYFERKHSGFECDAGTVPQYMRVSNTDMLAGHDFSIQPVSLESCQSFCSNNRAANGQPFSCKSFAYEKESQNCFLMDDGRSPGEGELITKKGMDFYEKLCIGAAQTCMKSPAFEKFPDRVLTGFAQVVIEEVLTEEACLTECVRSVTTMDFHCLSAMYYFDSRECILNFDTRLGLDKFFSNDTEGFRVSYYDNMCAIRLKHHGLKGISCPEGKSPVFVKYNNTELPDYQMDSFHSISLLDCIQNCDAATNFTCISLNYHDLDSSCSLSFVDSKSTPTVTSKDSVFLERHCVEDADVLCGAKKVAFEVEKHTQLVGVELISISGVSVEECLSLCLHDPSYSCSSVNFITTNFTCQLNNGTIHRANAVENPDSDYYESRCGSFDQVQRQFLTQTKPEFERQSSKATGVELTTQCNYGSMRVTVTGQQPFSGYVFATNKFDTCRVQLSNDASADLFMMFPNFGGDCGLVESSRNTYSAIIIVSMNNLGIPGLVSNGDKFFNVTCDYTSASMSRVKAVAPGLNVTDGKFVANIFPGGRIFIPDPVQMSLQRDDQPVAMAALGENMTLKWSYMPGFNRSTLGVFIRNCNASRVMFNPGGFAEQQFDDGNSLGNDPSLPGNQPSPFPEPEAMQMVQDGCPHAAVMHKIVTGEIVEAADGYSMPFTTFRFDGSKSVKIVCQIDICDKSCNPTTCSTVSGQSFGRKRRHTGIDAKQSRVGKDRVKKTGTSSFVFQVVDKLPESKYVSNLERSQNLRHPVGVVESFNGDSIPQVRKLSGNGMCLRRGTFMAVFIFLGLLCFCQVIVVATYAASKWLHEKKQV